MSSKTLRLDVNANLIPSRRSAPRGGIEVDLDAAIDRYAGGAPLASRLFIAFGEGRTPIEMVVETGLDPILVKRMWVAYIDMTRDPSVIQAKKNCRECTRTEAQCEQFSKEFAEACERTRVHDVKCCVRCHVPLTWNDDGENA